MASFLDFLNTPAGMGLLSGVASYAANARRGTPVNNVGRGLAGGLLGYQSAIDAQKAEQENAVARELRNMQIADMKRKQAEQVAVQQWKQGLPGVMDQAQTKVTPFEADDPFNEGPSAFGQVYGGEQHGQQVSGAMANVRPGNMQALQDYLMRPESPYADKLIERQLFPKQLDPVVLGKTLVNPATGETIAVDQTWKEEAAANREQRIEELQMRLQDQQLSREQNAALRRELAAQTAALQRESIEARRDAIAQGAKPQFGWRYKPDGTLEPVPGGPADQKAAAQNAASTDVEVALTTLRNAYDQLEKGGGITSTKNQIGSNVAAAVSSSAPGQLVGKVLGTTNQSARNDITMTRPALLAALMRATGMSARQMDSNAELKLWIATATDPTLDVESNRRALNAIEAKYLKKENKQENPNPIGTKRQEYEEYVRAYNQAKTKEQRDAINARARERGVIK